MIRSMSWRSAGSGTTVCLPRDDSARGYSGPSDGPLRAEHAHDHTVVAGGFVGEDLRDMQAGQCQIRSRLFQRDVRGVVRVDEELRTGPREPGDALREHAPDRRIVTSLPRRHAAA
jgi:hypothetical protein